MAGDVFVDTSNAGAVLSRIIEAANHGIVDWAQMVLDTAQANVPVLSGELRESGEVTVSVSGAETEVSVEFTSDHAAYVEFGTGIRGASSAGAGPGPYRSDWPGMPAQPYMRPAFDAHRNDQFRVQKRVDEALS